MAMTAVTLLYFSPTGTTRKVLEAIEEGLGGDTVKHIDLTSKGTRIQAKRAAFGDLTVIGVPVYTGRVALQAALRLQRIRVKDVPAVIVVVYGNREYEDALLELRNISREAGFTPLVGAAFIGEHSFSTKDNLIAEGRPDTEDLGKAEAFGRMVKEKINHLGSLESVPLLEVPGNFPYRDRNASLGTSPETIETDCIYCGKCVEVCPMTAIRLRDKTLVTDSDLCILCCACVKNCLSEARALKDPGLVEFAQKLGVMCRRRKEPEFFL
jgi:ferredoxin